MPQSPLRETPTEQVVRYANASQDVWDALRSTSFFELEAVRLAAPQLAQALIAIRVMMEEHGEKVN
jgi:hypothetical protein